jgi:DNA-directed RNA polymerase specialized sigma24 family protein
VRKKSEAQVYLERVEMIDCIIHNKLIEQQQWKDIALGITVSTDGEKVQSSGSQSRMSDAVIKCVDMEREIDSLIDELIDTKRKVISTIEQLDSPYYYRLLHLRYIQYIDFDEIAEKLNKDYNTITTAHGRALAQVQEILDREKGKA